MMKDVMLSVRSVQRSEDDAQTIEFETVGRFGVNNGIILISYEEPNGMLAAGSKTIVRFMAPETVVIKRTGDQQSRIEVIKGVRNNFFYNTPYGSLMLGIYGETVACDINENGGRLGMIYTIDSNLQHISRNEIEITVRGVQ